MENVLQYILGLGSTVFVPIVLFIIGLIFGQGFFKSFKIRYNGRCRFYWIQFSCWVDFICSKSCGTAYCGKIWF